MGRRRNKDKKRKKDKKRDKKQKKTPSRPMAETADKHILYQRAVQEPEADIDFFEEVFQATYGRTPTTLREDFCGTAFTSCTWVARRPENKAWGVDLDAPTLAWGLEHNAAPLSDEQRSRLTLIEGDVREKREPKVDIIAAQNFSYCVFKEREQLREYFRAARECLADEGVFILDIFGGPDAQQLSEEATEHEDEDFTYVWDQDAYDAVTAEILCKIHFQFPDRSEMRDAFIYDWRLWTIPELREVLREAGFKSADAYWEGVDEDGEGDGEFTKVEHAENEDAWIAYVVGVK